VYFGVDGSRRKFASRGMYYSADESPDGKFVLLTSIQYPFSYIVQLDRFPVSYAVHIREIPERVLPQTAY